MLLTVKEYARLHWVSPSYVYRLIRQNELDHKMKYKSVRIMVGNNTRPKRLNRFSKIRNMLTQAKLVWSIYTSSIIPTIMTITREAAIEVS